MVSFFNSEVNVYLGILEFPQQGKSLRGYFNIPTLPINEANLEIPFEIEYKVQKYFVLVGWSFREYSVFC